MLEPRARRVLALAAVTLPVASAFAGALFSCLPDLPVLGTTSDAGPRPSAPTCGDNIVQQAADGGGEPCEPDKSPGCTDDCRLVCDDGFVLSPGEHCYLRAGAASRYSDAVTACAGLGAHVVTLGSDEETVFVRSHFEGDHWLGLSENEGQAAFTSVLLDEPGYPIPPQSGPCAGCFGGPASLPEAGIGNDPTVDAGGSFSCVRAASTGDGGAGAWLRIPCTLGRDLPVICEREPVGVRGESVISSRFDFDVSVTRSLKSYAYVTTPVSGEQAKASCKSLGGRLVVFTHPREREDLAREILKIAGVGKVNATWIGLADEGQGWTWDDGIGAASRPPPWANREPAHGGRALLKFSPGYDVTLLQTSANPSTPFPYVCELAPRP
ncbi:MAG: C-type lectin domain-containing protein [Polyangiaceae bacterium]